MSSNWKKKSLPDTEFRRIGCIGKPHGLHGDFFLHLESELSSWLTSLEELWVFHNEEWKSWRIVHWHKNKRRPTLKLEELPDRTAVEAHNRVELFVRDKDAREALTPKTAKNTAPTKNADEEFFFHSDMEGLKVYHLDNPTKAVGQIIAIHELPGHHQLEIEKPDGKTFLLPFVKALVPEVDLEKGLIRARIPEGLEDLE